VDVYIKLIEFNLNQNLLRSQYWHTF